MACYHFVVSRDNDRQSLRYLKNSQTVVISLGVVHCKVDINPSPLYVLIALFEQVHSKILEGQIFLCTTEDVADTRLDKIFLILFHIVVSTVVVGYGKRCHGIHSRRHIVPLQGFEIML